MNKFLIKWFVNTIALLIVVNLVPGISVDNLKDAVIAALTLGLVNAFIRPVIILLTLPINVVSLGLFIFIINGFLFYIVSKMIDGFHIAGFGTALLGSILLSIISFFISLLLKPGKIISTNQPQNYNEQQPAKNNRTNVIEAEFKVEDENKK